VSPRSPGRTRDHHPPALFRAFLHCYYKNVYGIRPVTRELQNTVVWLSVASIDRRARDAVDRFLTDLEHVVDEVFDRLVEQPRLPRPARLDLLHRFHRREDDARRPRRVERLRSNRRRVLPRLRLYDRLDRAKIPIAAEFTESKQALEETAMRVTCDAPAVEKPIWMLGDSAYDTMAGTTTCWPQGSCQSLRTTHETPTIRKDIEYRVEARIDEHSEDVQLKQSTLQRDASTAGVESNEPTTPSRLRPGTFAPEAASTHEHKCSSRCAFVSLLRSPTTNAETIQEAPSSRYENYSMTPPILSSITSLFSG